MNEIQIQNVNGVIITLTQDALQLRDGILSEAQAITTLPDAETEQSAIRIVGRMNGFAKDMESCRKTVKAPILALGKKIDSIAEEALGDLEKEKRRIGGMLSEIAQRRQAETDRIQREADAKLAKLKTAPAKERTAEAAKVAVQAITSEKPKGSIVREVWNVEVFDIKALFAAKPLYVQLVPDLPMLKLAASRGDDLPGCRITKETKVAVRSA